MAHLRTLAGNRIRPLRNRSIRAARATCSSLTSGDIAALAAALSARGWLVDYSGTVVRITSSFGQSAAVAAAAVSPTAAAGAGAATSQPSAAAQ